MRERGPVGAAIHNFLEKRSPHYRVLTSLNQITEAAVELGFAPLSEKQYLDSIKKELLNAIFVFGGEISPIELVEASPGQPLAGAPYIRVDIPGTIYYHNFIIFRWLKDGSSSRYYLEHYKGHWDGSLVCGHTHVIDPLGLAGVRVFEMWHSSVDDFQPHRLGPSEWGSLESDLQRIQDVLRRESQEA